MATVAILAGLQGCGNHMYHRVKPGDTLSSISREYGYDYRDVAHWNGIDSPYTIHTGQVLRLAPSPPVSEWTLFSKGPATAPAMNQDPPSKVVTVQPAPERTPPARAPSSAQAAAVHWQWPARGRVINGFRQARLQNGVEIAGRSGEDIWAAAAGKVVYSGNGLKGYGNLVIIKHSEMFLSAYAHNDAVFVREGEHVETGQRIATMGVLASRQPGLHFEIRRDGKPVDPMKYLPRRQ